jgi:hypothetical protein
VKLVSMENGEAGMDTPAMAYQPCPYPYGLRLNLNQEQLAALGYDELPPAGTILRVEAVGCVTRSSSEDPDADGDIDYLCVEVQITQMGMEEETASSGKDGDAGTRAGRMYGKE